ncbi:hypothetical protein KCU98_g18966, partial [Aureobasidium melanogenum]
MASIIPKTLNTDEGVEASDLETSSATQGPHGHEQAHDSEPCRNNTSEARDDLNISGITAMDHADKDANGQAKDEYASTLDLDGVASQERIIEDAEPVASDVESTHKSVNDQAKNGSQNPNKHQPTLHRMHKFTLYETNARYWITGSDITDKYYKLLKIDRTAPPGQLSVFEDEIVYSKKEVTQLLTTIDDGNKATGGLRVKCSFWGILGFIRFTDSYYVLLITKRQQVAMIGGHYIYQVDGTELFPLTVAAGSRFARERNAEEGRFLGILNNLDLTRSFYFSYSYDITRTLQYNIIRQRNALNQGIQQPGHAYDDMFVWNHHLLSPAVKHLKNVFDWCLPIIHGFIDQSSLDVFGRTIYITIIGRRSRFFAGARFLKRGANDLG